MKKKNKTETYGIIGLGRFGMNLAISLAQSGREIVALDNTPEKIKAIAAYTDNAYTVRDLKKETLLEAGINNCDVVIVCIGEKIDTSILTTLTVIQLGVKRVIAKSMSEEHGCVLEKLGAEVVYPEKDMAIRLAKRLISPRTLEYISLSDEIDIAEITMTEKVDGKTVRELDIRRLYGLNIIAVKHGNDINTEIKPDDILHENDVIVVIGKTVNIKTFEASI